MSMSDHPPTEPRGRRPGPPPLPTRVAPPRQSEARHPQRRRKRGWLSVLGFGALALTCVVAGAAAFLVVAAPADLIRERIAERVKARSGLDLAVTGGASLALFPMPSLSLADIALSAPEPGSAPLLTAARLDAQVSLWSLFGSRPAVDQLTVYGPLIEVSADVLERPPGRVRSRAETPGAPADAAQASSAVEPRSDDAKPRGGVSRVGAGTLRIVDGTVRYRGRDGEITELTAVQLSLSAEGPSAPLALNGTATVRGAPITVSGAITPADALPTRQPAQLSIKVSGPPFEGSYEGMLSLAGGFSLSGELKLQVPSVAALSSWAGRPLPQAEGGDGAALAANIQASRERVDISDLRATLGSTILSGTLALETGGARRRLTGHLETSELDFGRLLLKSPARATNVEAGSAPPSSASPAQPPPEPRTRRDRRDWSDEPLNVSVLGVLDVMLEVAAQRITYKDLQTGPARLALALEGGAGSLKLEDVQLYGGRARGLLSLDGTGDALVTGANLKLQGVDLHPLLKDGLDFPWLEGRANLTLALAGQGNTERQIVEGLNGKVELVSRDGAIGGFDVGKAVRSIQSARVPNLSISPVEKTAYSELAGTFAVTNGVAANKDLRLSGPHLNLNGEGALDLGQRRIEYVMHTKVGAAPEPGATLKIGEIDVPLTITGPWDKPRLGIKGQEQLSGTIKQIGKNLKSQDVKDAIRDMLSGNGEKRVRPRELLDKLLKKD
jgi:AsmA protein